MSDRPALRIATRNSPLAMWQARHVAGLLQAESPELTVDFIDTATFPDKRLDLPISELGGKGAFSKEIQRLVLDGRADIAVHSAKDLQAVTPPGLSIAAFPERADCRDAIVGSSLDALPHGAVVATGSNRRRVQLAQLRPDLRFEGLRGNIATRLDKANQFDAIVMAAAALQRLDLDDTGRTTELGIDVLDVDVMVPQVGQGALAVECRDDDPALIALVGRIDHQPTRRLVSAERGFLTELGGDCSLPAGAHAAPVGPDGAFSLRAVLASPDERRVEQVLIDSGDAPEPATVGANAARALREALGIG